MRLEQRGLVRGEWGVTDNNRKARFYAITAAGRRQLATQRRPSGIAWRPSCSTLLRDQG